jgi:transmembrane sensor
MNAGEAQIRAAVAQQAGTWFVAHRAGSLDYAERAAFVAWLKASPIHVEEYLGVALIARDLAAAVDDPALSLDSVLELGRADVSAGVASIEPAVPARARTVARTGGLRRWPAIAMAAAASVAFAAVAWWVVGAGILAVPATYETARGEQGIWKLADGSELRLNTDSAATARFTREDRLVELERGQAHFRVARDAMRRFRVVAGDVEAIAIGTQFEVYRLRGTTVVTVSEGEVSVLIGHAPGASPGGEPDRAQRVNAGFQLRIDADSDSAQPMPVDLSQSLAWLQQKIAFEHRPLGDVADEFNRYAQVPLEIADPALRALPVSGVFETDDMESFVAFLETLDGVRVVRTADKVLIMRVRGAGLGAGDQGP